MNKLIKFIESHGNKIVSFTDDTITVIGVYCKDGVAFEKQETIESNIVAIRDWLGY